MIEVLLERVVEKLETLEISVQDIIGKLNGVTDYAEDFKKIKEIHQGIKMEIANIPLQLSIPEDEIRQLRKDIKELTSQLQKPSIQKVKNIHYLSKPVLACIAESVQR